MRISLGTDPEFFLKQDGKFISASNLIKGYKEDPEELIEGAGLMHDNVALEFTTPPATSPLEMVDSIGNCLAAIKNKLPGFSMHALPFAIFPKEELETEEAQKFGCSPDYDVYRVMINPPINPRKVGNARTCGGHIHLGFDDDIGMEGRTNLVKLSDVVLGTFSVLIDKYEESKNRLQIYGKAGSFRPTPYGVEYRFPNNVWLSTPRSVEATMTIAQTMCEMFYQGKLDSVISTIRPNAVRKALNTFDRISCVDLASKLPSKLKEYIFSNVEIPSDSMYANWGI